MPFAELSADAALAEPSAAGGAPALADALQLLADAGLVASRGAAKRIAEQGGLYVNGARRGMADRFIRESDLLAGSHVLLRKGARDYALVRIAR